MKRYILPTAVIIACCVLFSFADSLRTRTQLIGTDFADGQNPGEITAEDLRNFIATATPHYSTSDPTVNDDVNVASPGPFGVGTLWVNTTDNGTFVCVDSTDGAAVWAELSALAGSPSFDELTVTGALDVNHTSTFDDDDAVKVSVDAAGFGDVKGVDVNYDTGAIATGELETAILVNIDETAATGGEVYGLEVLSTDGSADSIWGMKHGAVVGPIIQDSGTFANPTTGTNNTASTDVPAMLDGATGTSTTIFVADNDYIIIGAAAEFTEIEFIIETPAGNPGVQPTFAYSTAGSGQFTTFVPVDGTNGFRNTGVVAWDAVDLTGHATNDDTGTYDIKITRTSNSQGSVSLYYAKTAATVVYSWDASGDLNVNSVTASGFTTNSGNTYASAGNIYLDAAAAQTHYRRIGGTAFETSTTNNTSYSFANSGTLMSLTSTTGQATLNIVGTSGTAGVQASSSGTTQNMISLDTANNIVLSNTTGTHSGSIYNDYETQVFYRHGGSTTNLNLDASGNLGLGTTSYGTNAASVLAIANGTAPTSSPADSVQLYAEDVTTSSELKVRDEAGNVSTISPHPHDAPDSLYWRGRGLDEFHVSKNMFAGTIEWFNMSRFHFDDSATKADCRMLETFTAYNTRRGLSPGDPGHLVIEDWDTAETAKQTLRNQQRTEWANTDPSERGPQPAVYSKRTKPDWLTP